MGRRMAGCKWTEQWVDDWTKEQMAELEINPGVAGLSSLPS